MHGAFAVWVLWVALHAVCRSIYRPTYCSQNSTICKCCIFIQLPLLYLCVLPIILRFSTRSWNPMKEISPNFSWWLTYLRPKKYWLSFEGRRVKVKLAARSNVQTFETSYHLNDLTDFDKMTNLYYVPRSDNYSVFKVVVQSKCHIWGQIFEWVTEPY